jgi:hypothetical protein
MQTDDAPPPVLDMARVLAYAIVDDSVQWTGRQTIFVGGEELGPVPCLALAQSISGELKDVLTFHCNEQWDVLGVSGGDTLEEAEARADRAYRGIGERWIERNTSVEKAQAWILENNCHVICFFCGRHPGEFQSLVTGKLATICDVCVGELYPRCAKGMQTMWPSAALNRTGRHTARCSRTSARPAG